MAAGLACGGTARSSCSRPPAYPVEPVAAAGRARPVCLVTPIGADGQRVVHARRRSASAGPEVPRLFGRGVTATAVVAGPVAVVSLWPVPTLVVVGDGLIAAALATPPACSAGSARSPPDVNDAVAAVDALNRSDAVVVLSHDREVDGPALSSRACGRRVGYVGALGLAAHPGGAARVAHRQRALEGPGAHPRPGRARYRRAHAGRDRDLDRRRDPRQSRAETRPVGRCATARVRCTPRRACMRRRRATSG